MILPKIVLVEDDPLDADLTTRELKKIPLANDVLHFVNGEAFLNFLTPENAEIISVILLDLKMPKVGGIEVLRALKKNPKTALIPVVILTSSLESPDIKTCYELGVNAFINKPVDLVDFQETIKAVGLFWAVINQIPSQNIKERDAV